MTRQLRDVTLPADWSGVAPLTMRPSGGRGAYRFEPGDTHTLALTDDEAAALERDYGYQVEDVAADRLRRGQLERLDDEILTATYEETFGRKPGQRKRETIIDELVEAEESEDELATDDAEE